VKYCSAHPNGSTTVNGSNQPHQCKNLRSSFPAGTILKVAEEASTADDLGLYIGVGFIVGASAGCVIGENSAAGEGPGARIGVCIVVGGVAGSATAGFAARLWFEDHFGPAPEEWPTRIFKF
jgi:hypothetical protein